MMLDSLTFRRAADPLEQSREKREPVSRQDLREINELGPMGDPDKRGMAEPPSRWPLARTWTTLAMALTLVATPLGQAFAQQRVAVVRDAEIESLVRDYAKPILQAAGLSKSGIGIVLVNDRHFNAFVDGRRIFINTGAIAMAETPNEIIGVLAHETGHLAGGHQQNLRQQIAQMKTMAIVASLLGVGAMAVGAATDTKGLGKAGVPLMAGGMEMARRSLLTYQRAEEAAADRSAITYLERTKQSAKGMLATFRRFQGAMSLAGTQADPYLQSHPMPQDRIESLQTLARSSPYFEATDSAQLQLRHDLVRAKIAAFTGSSATAAQLWRKDPTGLAASYGDAISTYLNGSLKSALAKADALIKAMPKYPYFYELRGDILVKANRPKDAAASYAKAISLDPGKSSLLQVSYGQALVASGDRQSMETAVTTLKNALDRDKENVDGYRYLAQAYGTLGDIGQAQLATAEGYFYGGGYKDAKIFAARAQQMLKRGTPGWVRAQDIINFKIPKKN
jgi:predicted Zn-dependent protease